MFFKKAKKTLTLVRELNPGPDTDFRRKSDTLHCTNEEYIYAETEGGMDPLSVAPPFFPFPPPPFAPSRPLHAMEITVAQVESECRRCSESGKILSFRIKGDVASVDFCKCCLLTMSDPLKVMINRMPGTSHSYVVFGTTGCATCDAVGKRCLFLFAGNLGSSSVCVECIDRRVSL